MYEAGLFRPGRADDYRQPDNLVARREYVSVRGVEGRAELVVEIRSPNDESYEKLPFYAEMKVQEVLFIDGSLVELRRLVEGAYVLVDPDVDGWVHLAAVPLALRPGPANGSLVARTPTEEVEI